MGERLVVEIKRNKKTVASTYYHWSAYTVPALNIVAEMYKHVLSQAYKMNDKEFQLALIRYVEKCCAYGYVGDDAEKKRIVEESIARIKENVDENTDSYKIAIEMMEDMLSTHGGICGDDIEYAKEKYPGEDFAVEGVNRSDGLVAISESSIENFNSWAQAVMIVDLDENKVYNGAVYDYSFSDYMAEMEDWDEEDFLLPDELEQVPINMVEFPLNEIAIVCEIAHTVESSYVRFEDTIYEFIE
jgi:hypothetical protein